MLPTLSVAMPFGELILAFMAAPLSPVNPDWPFPAMVVIIPEVALEYAE